MNKIKYFTVISFSLFLLLSCSNSDELTDQEIFGGLFTGKISYSDSQVQYNYEDAVLTVEKTGLGWYFIFPDEIPDLDNIELISDDGGRVLMNPEPSENRLIRLTARTIQIVYSDSLHNWNVNAVKN